MKTNIILLFLLIHLTGFSQVEWAPIGAKWHYNHPGTASNDFVVLESIKDTTILGNVSRSIEVRLNGTVLVNQEYIFQNGDSIFYFNENHNSFFLLYNFSAKAGDTITVHSDKFKPTKSFFSYNDSITDFKYKILSVDSVQISGQWFKRQKVALLKDGLWSFSKPDGNDHYIINKIGGITYFFGVQSGITPEDNPSLIRCYSDSKVEFKNALWSFECDIISAATDIKLLNCNMIYPNPFDDQLNIHMLKPIEFIEIFDINGLKLQTTYVNKSTTTINTSFLHKGLYLLRIKTYNNTYSKKIIKN